MCSETIAIYFITLVLKVSITLNLFHKQARHPSPRVLDDVTGLSRLFRPAILILAQFGAKFNDIILLLLPINAEVNPLCLSQILCAD